MRRLLFLLALGSAALGLDGWAQLPAPINLRVMREIFVSPSGSSGNAGTIASPLSLSAGLSRASKSNAIVLLPGNYPSFNVTTPGATIRSYSKWAAVVVGSPAAHGVDLGAPNVTVDGLQISKTYLDGIKVNSSGNVIRNCWIHHAGLGNPNAVPNSDASYSGQGIYCGPSRANNIIEYNLIEYNGIWNGHDHGIYIGGTNHIIRGNVFRYNWAFGIQLYPSYDPSNLNLSCSGIKIYNNLVYGNGVYNGGQNCFVVWASPPDYTLATTNYLYNNILISKAWYPINSVGGYLAATNNILLGSYGGTILVERGGTVWSDYNLFTNAVATSGVVNGGHNLRVSSAGFVNSAKGLFWLSSGSPARNAAAPSIIPPVDFFGRPQLAISDIGPFQFDPVLAADTRDMDPSPTVADYWSFP